MFSHLRFCTFNIYPCLSTDHKPAAIISKRLPIILHCQPHYLPLSQDAFTFNSSDIIGDGPFQTVFDIIKNGPFGDRFLSFFDLWISICRQAVGLSGNLWHSAGLRKEQIFVIAGDVKVSESFISAEARHGDLCEGVKYLELLTGTPKAAIDWPWHFL